MILKDILQVKGMQVHAISPEATLDDVVQELVRLNIGSLMVYDPESEDVLGIITERDILRTYAAHKAPLEQLTVGQSMSAKLITARPEDRVEQAMALMTTHRVRHLPTMSQGRIMGVISIGDIVKAQHDEIAKENYFMRSYIQGEGAEIGTV